MELGAFIPSIKLGDKNPSNSDKFKHYLELSKRYNTLENFLASPIHRKSDFIKTKVNERREHIVSIRKLVTQQQSIPNNETDKTQSDQILKELEREWKQRSNIDILIDEELQKIDKGVGEYEKIKKLYNAVQKLRRFYTTRSKKPSMVYLLQLTEKERETMESLLSALLDSEPDSMEEEIKKYKAELIEVIDRLRAIQSLYTEQLNWFLVLSSHIGDKRAEAVKVLLEKLVSSMVTEEAGSDNITRQRSTIEKMIKILGRESVFYDSIGGTFQFRGKPMAKEKLTLEFMRDKVLGVGPDRGLNKFSSVEDPLSHYNLTLPIKEGQILLFGNDQLIRDIEKNSPEITEPNAAIAHSPEGILFLYAMKDGNPNTRLRTWTYVNQNTQDDVDVFGNESQKSEREVEQMEINQEEREKNRPVKARVDSLVSGMQTELSELVATVENKEARKYQEIDLLLRIEQLKTLLVIET